MTTTPIQLVPQYKEMIWGGDRLRTLFGRNIPSNKTGESWEIHSDNQILGTEKTLRDIAKDPTIVGSKMAALDEFPLLVKIITAEDDLSIQVHPDDAYAQAVEKKPYGKTECWYVLDAPVDGQLIIGLSPEIQTKEALTAVIKEGRISEALQYLPIKKGDFFYIPAGLVHAITKGVTILEVQQTSDITYRIYDYDRMGIDGKPRELHVDKSIDVIKLDPVVNPTKGTTTGHVTTFVSNDYFSVERHVISGKVPLHLSADSASILSCTKGNVTLHFGERTHQLTYGDHLLLPVGMVDCAMSSQDGEIVLSYL